VAFALAQQSLLGAEYRDWSLAETYAAQAWERVTAGHVDEQLPSLAAYAARARVAAYHGDTQAARRYLAGALRLYDRSSQLAFPWLAAQLAIDLCQVFVDLGDLPAARIKVNEVQRHLLRLLAGGVRGEPRTPSPLGPASPALTEAELRVLLLLPTHLSLSEIGEELHVTRNTVKSQVAAIYRKLQASSRRHAVRRGQELGLLDE
jgi:LuxR family maltose regulon positive regulatory protein